MSTCEDCPPRDYPTDETRCEPCPRREVTRTGQGRAPKANMKISEFISVLEKAKAEHGDLPVYTEDSDIAALKIHACFDGGMSWTDGKPDHTPNEFVLEFVPA